MLNRWPDSIRARLAGAVFIGGELLGAGPVSGHEPTLPIAFRAVHTYLARLSVRLQERNFDIRL